MIELIDVNVATEHAVGLLYALLVERDPEVNISHRQMPTMTQHEKFLRENPYLGWYLIKAETDGMYGPFVGATYLTRRREIGVFILREHRRKGYAGAAVQQMLLKYPGRMLANINPKNEASLALFAKFNAKPLQHTYELTT